MERGYLFLDGSDHTAGNVGGVYPISLLNKICGVTARTCVKLKNGGFTWQALNCLLPNDIPCPTNDGMVFTVLVLNFRFARKTKVNSI